MGLSQADREEPSLTMASGIGECKRPPPLTPPAVERSHRAEPQEKIRSASSKPRRPDRAVYVPRARRAAESAATDDKCNPEDPATDTRKRRDQTTLTPNPKCKAPRDKSNPGTPRKSLDKNFCNVYTPPHLRITRSHTTPATDDENTSELVPSVLNSDSVDYSDATLEGESFYIGDYFASGQLGLYDPNLYYKDFREASDKSFSECNNRDDYTVYPTNHNWSQNTNELNMSVPDSNTSIISNGYNYSKDEDEEKDELRRASQEINRSNKRIIKQSFHSDVLVISDPVEQCKDEEPPRQETDAKEVTTPIKQKPKLEAKVTPKREENDWDAVFDDSGECLDPSLLEELTATVGKVHISKARNNYEQYQTKGQTLFNGPYDESFAHVVEVYDFPTEFKTNDLLSVFSEYKDTGFEIKWVDDTHALIVFSSAKIAAEVLSSQRPLVRCRPLSAATAESRNKAKKCAEFLQPYRQRPETCLALARRLVSGALGVRLQTAPQERAAERRLLSAAREKKRQAALHKEAAWDGSLGQPL